MEEKIRIVRKFNQENRYRDGGVLNNAIDDTLNELERLQKENNDLRAIRETVRYIEEDGEKDDLYYVVGRGSYLANVLENAQDFEKTVHTCLHCGKDTPLYCETCYQELITKNAELQMRYEKIDKFLHSNSFVFQNENGDIQGMLLTPENFIPKQVIRDELKDIELAIAFCENENRFKELIIKKRCLKEILGDVKEQDYLTTYQQAVSDNNGRWEDKIRDKIQLLEKELKLLDKNDKHTKIENDYIISVLKELLGE